MQILKTIQFLPILIVVLFARYHIWASELGEIKTAQIWTSNRDKCRPGLYLQPNGPVGVMLFCEDAIGTYIGLIYYENMETPAPEHFLRYLNKEEKKDFYNVWSLADRMWQDPLWASDVTSFAWLPNGTKLIVSTSNIYGSGALYEIDVIRKEFKQIAPINEIVDRSDPGPGFIITGIDTANNKLLYETYSGDKEKNKFEYIFKRE